MNIRTIEERPITINKVHVIVPVYRGLEATSRCLIALGRSELPEGCKVTIINDASQEREMAHLLEQIIHTYGFRLETNSKNLGFVATTNKGMSLYPDHDVVLLNSDTEVPTQWLQRLTRCAYTTKDIGTVTPFSNNATICSYPHFCSPNDLPDGLTISDLDGLFQTANRDEIVDIPTAVGFCMFIKRDCLLETGLFDEKSFGLGYGEENDFCMRASAKGWRHVLCADLFVFHSGAISFGHEHTERVQQALSVLYRLYPRYPALIASHLEADPALHLRHRVNLLRIALSGRAVILFISHALEGGIVKHEKDMADQFRDRCIFLRITPSSDNVIFLKWWDNSEALTLKFRLPDQWNNLIECLRMLQVERIHYHHLLDLSVQIQKLPNELTIPYDITIHDYYMICPRIALIDHNGNYCGEPDENGCLSCLRNAPKSQRDIHRWRNDHCSFLSGANRIFCPSHDVLTRFTARFDLDRLIYAPHPEIFLKRLRQPNPTSISDDENLRILVIGGLSTHKGADLLETAAKDAIHRNLPIEYTLLGHAWRNLTTKPKTALTVLGKYDDKNLQLKLNEIDAHLIWFPALWPETYSYTLSAALIANLPVVAPNLGAFTERLSGRAWTWICPWRQPANIWNDFFVDIRKKNFVSDIPPASPDTFKPDTLPIAFDWQRNYLLLKKKEVAYSNISFNLNKIANQHSRMTMPFSKRLINKIRIILLAFGLWLRSHPILAPIARMVAIKLQYRIRHCLLRNR